MLREWHREGRRGLSGASVQRLRRKQNQQSRLMGERWILGSPRGPPPPPALRRTGLSAAGSVWLIGSVNHVSIRLAAARVSEAFTLGAAVGERHCVVLRAGGDGRCVPQFPHS